MSKYGRHGGKYDTPTDGISKKVFDRHKDKMERRYGELKQEVTELRRTLKAILKWKADLFLMGKALPDDRHPPKM